VLRDVIRSAGEKIAARYVIRKTLTTLIRRYRSLRSVYRGVGFFQRMFLGKIHRRKLFVAVVDPLGSSRVLYQREVALPIAVHKLTKLHLDFHTLVGGLNHGLIVHL
jgi:hypothetical protein